MELQEHTGPGGIMPPHLYTEVLTSLCSPSPAPPCACERDLIWRLGLTGAGQALTHMTGILTKGDLEADTGTGSLDRVWGDRGVSQALLVRAGHQGMWPRDVQEMPKGEVGKSLVGRMLEG